MAAMGRAAAALGLEAAAQRVSEFAQAEAGALAQEQIDRLRAKQRAIKFAQQTNGRLAFVQLEEGPTRWIVFKNGAPLAAFPPYSGDLSAALTDHEKLRFRAPGTVRATLPIERTRRGVRRLLGAAAAKWARTEATAVEAFSEVRALGASRPTDPSD